MLKRLTEYTAIALSFSFVIKLLFLLDLNKRVYNHTPGGCRLVQFIANGSAGMEFEKELHGAFITSGFIKSFGYQKLHGNIYFYDLSNNNREYEAKKMQIEKGFDRKKFAPYGISSFSSKGRVMLYVTNNYGDNSSVEVFQVVSGNSLRHRKSLRHAYFQNLMGIVVVGADRFVVTNFVYSRLGIVQLAELALQSPFGSIVYYNGKEPIYLEKYFSAPNGLAVDRKNDYLYVASGIEEVIHVYSLKKDLSLVRQIEISLLSSPMNIFVDQGNGDLWIATQPVLYKTYQHLRDPLTKKNRSPSQVLRVRIQKDRKSWIITEPYANDGATLWGSSSVVFDENQMLVGSLFGRLLHCDIDYPLYV